MVDRSATQLPTTVERAPGQEAPGREAATLVPAVHDGVQHPARERIVRELDLLYEGGLRAELRACPQYGPHGAVVIYRAVPVTDGAHATTRTQDVIVPVPGGYPAGAIDLAGLPHGSPLLARLKGGTNPQGTITADGRQWTLASYHPHQNGGGRPWNRMVDGFHTYIDHLIAWLACQS